MRVKVISETVYATQFDKVVKLAKNSIVDVETEWKEGYVIRDKNGKSWWKPKTDFIVVDDSLVEDEDGIEVVEMKCEI